jgi:hypothetical protein
MQGVVAGKGARDQTGPTTISFLLIINDIFFFIQGNRSPEP